MLTIPALIFLGVLPVLGQEQPPLDEAIRAAEGLEAAGKTAEAVEAWKQVAIRATREQAVEGHRAAGRILALLKPAGRFEELEVAVRDVLQAHTGEAWALGYLAIVQQERGKTAEAVETFGKIVALAGPESGWASHNIGLILERDPGKKLEAADAFVNAVRLAPDMKSAWAGQALFKAEYIAWEMVDFYKRSDAARGIWEALRALPQLEPAQRGYVCLRIAVEDYQQARFPEAEALLKKAMELDPANAEYVSNLGLVYLSWGLPEKARDTWLRALEVDPAYADAVENLAIWHMKRGDGLKAAEYFSRGLELAVKALLKAAEALAAASGSDSTRVKNLTEAWNLARLRVFRFETYLRKSVKS